MDKRQKTMRVPVQLTFTATTIADGIVEVSVEEWEDVERIAELALAAVNYITTDDGSLIMTEGDFTRMVERLKASK